MEGGDGVATLAPALVAACAAGMSSLASSAGMQHAQAKPSARAVVRDRGTGVKVPKSSDHWMVVGVFVASRAFPTLPFWLPLVEPGTSKRLELAVPYKTMMVTLSPKYTDREKILLHVRVVQRIDACGQKLTGEVRYLCTDIAVSYHMGDNAFKWISFQSVHTLTHVLNTRSQTALIRIQPARRSLPRLPFVPLWRSFLFLFLFPACAVRRFSRCAAARGIRRSTARSWRTI
jgi:hypothetical protein